MQLREMVAFGKAVLVCASIGAVSVWREGCIPGTKSRPHNYYEPLLASALHEGTLHILCWVDFRI